MITIELSDKSKKAKAFEDLLTYLQDKKWRPVVKGKGNGDTGILCQEEDPDNPEEPVEREYPRSEPEEETPPEPEELTKE